MQSFSQTKPHQLFSLTFYHSHDITIIKSQWGSLLSIKTACSFQDFLCMIWTIPPFPRTVSLPHLPHLWKSYSHCITCFWSIFKTQSHSKVHWSMDNFIRMFPDLQFPNLLFLKTIFLKPLWFFFPTPPPHPFSFTVVLLYFTNLTMMYCSL